MRNLCLILAALLGTSAFARPATLRVDFFHSGNATQELYSLDEVVREPLPWPGNPERPFDETPRGKYLFEIRDTASGDLLYSRSFSSIYGEWETTGEARRLSRTFHESVRFPEPGAPFTLVLHKRDANHAFQEAWRIDLDPADYMVHELSAQLQEQVHTIVDSGDPSRKVDLLILGDGYTKDETAHFLARARELTEALFAVSPFRERREDFNVFALAPPARESGVSRPSTGLHRESPLGARYDAFRSERYVLTYENRALRDIAANAPYDAIEILTNSDTYGGGGIYGLYSTAAADNDWAGYLFVHEFGHHFAGLADEYYTSPVAYEAPASRVEPYEPNVTALLNPRRLKWRHLSTRRAPLPTPWPKARYDAFAREYQARRATFRAEKRPEADMNALFRNYQRFAETLFGAAPHQHAVGAFEGAGYESEGLYRPEMNCLMFTRTDTFCRVCQHAIGEVIDLYSRPQGRR